MWQDELRTTASRQHGVVSGRDIDRLQVQRGALTHELKVGGWVSRAKHVWTVLGSPDTSEQQVMIALLAAGPGAAISHRSAAALWGLPGFDLEPIHLTRIRGTNSSTPTAAVVHRVRRLRIGHVVDLGPFAVTRPEITLIQLAATLHRGQTEILLDRMWNKRLLDGRILDRAVRQMSAKGRRGVSTVRDLLDERGMDWTPPASGLESRVRSVLERNGIAGFRLQVDIGGEEWIGRVDFAHTSLPVILEVQSDLFHTALSDKRTDRIRHAKLRAAGYQVLEIWESDVWYHPERWVETVYQATLRRAG